MATLAELTVQVLSQRLVKKEMTLDEIQSEMLAISKMIKAIDEGTAEPLKEVPAAEETKPKKINMKKVFKDKEVICLICNKGFTTLKRHLKTAHEMDDKVYKKQFGIPPKTKLVAKAYAEKRRKDALERDQGAVLARSRETRSADKAAAVPAVQIKADVPVVRKKAAVPATTKKVIPKPGM